MIFDSYTMILTSSSPSNWFMNTIAFWTFLLLGSMCIGGFFMMRKFLKVLPKADGKSKLDWQNYWVETSRHLWTDEAKAFWISSSSLYLGHFVTSPNIPLLQRSVKLQLKTTPRKYREIIVSKDTLLPPRSGIISFW